MPDSQQPSPQQTQQDQAQAPQIPQSAQTVPDSSEPQSSAPSGDNFDEALDMLRDAQRGQSEQSEPKESLETGATEGVSKSDRQGKSEKEDAAPVSTRSDRVKPSALSSFHRAQKEFEAQRQAFAAEKAEAAKMRQLLDNAKVDRLAALEAMGYKDVKTFLQGLADDGGRMTPERQQLQELTQWREKQELAEKERQNQFQQQQEMQANQAKLDQVRRQVQDKIKSEQFAQRLINLPQADQQVMAQMDQMAAETGEMPNIDEAIEAVEGRFQGFLEEMAANSAVVDFFTKKLGAQKSAPMGSPQSKSRERTRTIDSSAQGPGLRQRSFAEASDDGAAEMSEALAYLNSLR